MPTKRSSGRMFKVWPDGTGGEYRLDPQGSPLPQEIMDLSPEKLRAILGDQTLQTSALLGNPISGSTEQLLSAPNQLLPRYESQYDNMMAEMLGKKWYQRPMGVNIDDQSPERRSSRAREMLIRALRGNPMKESYEILK